MFGVYVNIYEHHPATVTYCTNSLLIFPHLLEVDAIKPDTDINRFDYILFSIKLRFIKLFYNHTASSHEKHRAFLYVNNTMQCHHEISR